MKQRERVGIFFLAVILLVIVLGRLVEKNDEVPVIRTSEQWAEKTEGLQNKMANPSNLQPESKTSEQVEKVPSGAQWIQVNTGLPPQASVTTPAFSGSNLYVGVGMYSVDDSHIVGPSLWRSTNYGDSWTEVSKFIKLPAVNVLAISSSNLFVGFLSGYGIWRSTNGGESWTKASKGLPEKIAINALLNSGSNLFAGNSSGIGGVYSSTNNGASWNNVSAELPDIAHVRTLAASGSRLFAGIDSHGIWRSSNGGQSWTNVSKGLPTKSSVSALLVSGSRLYSGIYEILGNSHGVWYSINGGESWSKASTGLPENPTINSLLISNSKLFAGIGLSDGRGGGVWRSSDNGENWTKVSSSGLPMDASVAALAASGSYLFARAYSSSSGKSYGIWRIPL